MNLRHNLIEVKADTKEAVFEHLDSKEQVTSPYHLPPVHLHHLPHPPPPLPPPPPPPPPPLQVTVPYDLLHITPPMTTPDALATNTDLADPAGFLNVNKETLQHNT